MYLERRHVRSTGALMLKHLEANEPELYAGIMEIANALGPPERGCYGPRLGDPAQDRYRLRGG